MVSREGFPKEMTFEKRPEEREVASHADICGKGTSGSGTNMYKGSEVGTSLAY